MKHMQFGTAAVIAFLAGCSGTEGNGTTTPGADTTGVQTTTAPGPTVGGPTTTSSTDINTSSSNPSPNTTGLGQTSTDSTPSQTTPGNPPTSSNTAPAPSQTPSSETEPNPTDGSTTTTSDSTEETSEDETTGPSGDDVVDLGADEKFSFFVTSYHHLALLSGSADGFGGDLRYKGAATGLEGADAICQEVARRVSFGHKTWRAYLSTSTVNAIDRIGSGPWYDFIGMPVANSPSELIAGANRQPGGCCANGTYDELGLFHDGSTDQNNDGIDDDDHDTMTATNTDGTYAGFSCEDWTSVTAVAEDVGTIGGGGGGTGGGGGGGFPVGGGGGGGFPGGGFGPSGGIMMGHSWPAGSGQHWATSHGGHNCAAGTNFIQDGPGSPDSVGGGGGYGGFYCFALSE